MNTTTDEDDLDPLDREALERAMKLASSDPGRRRQLDNKLQDESWLAVATFAAYCMQSQNLHLKPREYPPCWGSETPLGYHGDQREAWEVCKRLLAAGLSRWEPDPISALAERSRTGLIADPESF